MAHSLIWPYVVLTATDVDRLKLAAQSALHIASTLPPETYSTKILCSPASYWSASRRTYTSACWARALSLSDNSSRVKGGGPLFVWDIYARCSEQALPIGRTSISEPPRKHAKKAPPSPRAHTKSQTSVYPRMDFTSSPRSVNESRLRVVDVLRLPLG